MKYWLFLSLFAVVAYWFVSAQAPLNADADAPVVEQRFDRGLAFKWQVEDQVAESGR